MVLVCWMWLVRGAVGVRLAARLATLFTTASNCCAVQG